DFGQEAHGVFGAAIDFRMTLLPPVAFDFRHRHALDAQCGELLPHVVELEGFDDRRDELHPMSFRLSSAPANAMGSFASSRSVPQCSEVIRYWNNLILRNR